MTAKTKSPHKNCPTARAGSPARAKRASNASSLGKGRQGETNRRAAAVLEVLAGQRTPSEAAAALGLSVNYYYVLERKALEGLLSACQPQPQGPPQPSSEQQLARLERELAKCRQECQRQASLVRAAERAIGLSAVEPSGRGKAQTANEGGGRKAKRRRRPTVRALRAAKTLHKNSSSDSPPDALERPSVGQDNSTCVAADKESGDGARRPQAAGGGAC